MAKDEMIGWYHWLNGHEFEQTSGDGKDRDAWHTAVSGVTKSCTQLSDWITSKSLKKIHLEEKEKNCYYCYLSY